jgi:hypothetical protein
MRGGAGSVFFHLRNQSIRFGREGFPHGEREVEKDQRNDADRILTVDEI